MMRARGTHFCGSCRPFVRGSKLRGGSSCLESFGSTVGGSGSGEAAGGDGSVRGTFAAGESVERSGDRGHANGASVVAASAASS